MGNHHFALAQVMPRHGDTFVQKAARILPQVQNQAFYVSLSQAFEIVFHLLAGVLVELG